MNQINKHPDILIVEDDDNYRAALCDMLALEGFSADSVDSVQAFSRLPYRESYSLLLLDRNLPDGDGLEILKLHRQVSDAPVVFITCEGRLEDRVAGMDADADYYLVKPVKTDELLAIVHRCFRRQQLTTRSVGWLLDVRAWTLQDPEGHRTSLTRTETLLLRAFVKKPGIAVTRDEIIVSLGKEPTTYDHRRLEVAIRRLRKKSEIAQLAKLPLETVYGVGYVLNADLSSTQH